MRNGKLVKMTAPENKLVAAIRATARKVGKNKLSTRQNDAEIRATARKQFS